MTQQPIRLWDDPARDYRQRYRLPDQFTWDDAAWPRIDFDGYTSMAFDLLPPAPARVLDVGCGPGLGSLRLLERGYEVTGVDYSERAIGFAELLVPDGRFVRGDIRALADVAALERGFDAAVCVEVLEHVPPEHRHLVLEGIHERLGASGALIATTPSPRMASNVWDYPRPDLRELRALFDASGFSVRQIRFQHRLMTPFHPRVWRLISNRVYDLRGLRAALRARFLRTWNEASSEARAGRFIILGERA